MVPKSEKKRAVRNGGVSGKVREYFAHHPGIEIWVSDLARELGMSERSIQQAIAVMIRSKAEGPLQAIQRGRSWIYSPAGNTGPNRSKESRLFEELAVTKSGDIVAQDQNGRAYIIKEL